MSRKQIDARPPAAKGQAAEVIAWPKAASTAPDRNCGWGSRDDPRPRTPFTSTPRKLTAEAQEYVVHRLAAFDRLAVVQRAVLEKFGVNVSYQTIGRYDPTRFQGNQLSEKWRSLFYATREAVLKNSAEIGASHVLVRIRWRERMALDAMEAGNFQLANEILDCIAAEVDRHRHEHSAENSVPLVATINISGLPEPAAEPEAVAGVLEPCD